jgi:hypothetical protein
MSGVGEDFYKLNFMSLGFEKVEGAGSNNVLKGHFTHETESP